MHLEGVLLLGGVAIAAALGDNDQYMSFGTHRDFIDGLDLDLDPGSELQDVTAGFGQRRGCQRLG
jgi:hypothetical protein